LCVGSVASFPHYQEVYAALTQVTIQLVRVPDTDTKIDARIAPGEPIYHCGNEACRQRSAACNPNFPSGRVGKEFNVLHALPQLVEGGVAASEHGAPELGEFDAVRVSLKKTYTESAF
jgi:hypothetical protein